MITCVVCNKEFIPWDSRTKYVCSSKCHGIRLREPFKKKYSLNPKLCKSCNNPIPYEKYLKRNTTCSKKCRKDFQSYNATKHNKNRMVWRLCAECGKHHKNKKYCSRKCSAKAKILPWTDERREKYRLKNLLGVRKYQARRYNQTPPDIDYDKIKSIYENCPPGYEVDHIIPISKGGLHHQNNLQYLTIHKNRSKSNKMDAWLDQ